MIERGPPVIRSGPDRFRLHLDAHERGVIAGLARELRMELDKQPDGERGAGLERLYPAAFPDDPDREAAYADLVRAELEDGRRRRLAAVEDTADAAELDEEQAAAWLGACNDLRLVLGTSLGVMDGEDDAEVRRGDPEATRRIVFAYLGWLVGSFVDALAAGLPDDPDDPDAGA